MAESQYLHNRLARSSAVNVPDYPTCGNAECEIRDGRLLRGPQRALCVSRWAERAVLFSARNSKASYLTVNRALYRTSMIRIKSSMRPRSAIYTLYYKSLSFLGNTPVKTTLLTPGCIVCVFFFFLPIVYLRNWYLPSTESLKTEIFVFSFFF